LVSLVGGASLGPEAALGMMGGGLGTWVSKRRKLDEDERATNTLSGMSGAYGGMLSSPILSTVFVIEIGRSNARRFAETLMAALLSASVAFAIYFPIAGSTFVGLYTLPTFKYHDWQLLAAIPLGLAAGALALITVVAIGVFTKLVARSGNRPILKATVGGIAFGLVGVALPLTLFTGTSQLTTVIHDGAALGAGLVIAVVFAKILVFALCEATGFIGGPFLVMLFIGGSAEIAAHVMIPGLPEGLAFAAMFAALPGSLVGAPFSLLLLAALTTQIGTLQMAPVVIAVITSYLAVSGSGALVALARQAKKPAASDAPVAPKPSPRTVCKLTRRIGAETVAELTRALIVKATREKRFRPRAVRIDSTVTEADVKYPTGAGLASSGVRALARDGRKLARLINEKRLRDRSRSMGHKLRTITRTVRRRSGEAKQEVLN
jgi:H+/Cl- antiporter ClcA